MFEKIFNWFFEKSHQTKCLTVIKERESTVCEIFTRKKNKQEEKTCLSEYFNNRRGLNMSEREKFFSVVFKRNIQQ